MKKLIFIYLVTIATILTISTIILPLVIALIKYNAWWLTLWFAAPLLINILVVIVDRIKDWMEE